MGEKVSPAKYQRFLQYQSEMAKANGKFFQQTCNTKHFRPEIQRLTVTYLPRLQ